MNNRYVLVLASLNPDRTDLAGVKYPSRGFVEATKYKPDASILHGLYGTLWGRTENSRWMNTDPDAAWLVIKCEQNDEIISLDKESNLVKFRCGMVVFDGCRADCYRYIDDNTPTELKDQLDIAGRIVETLNENHHILLGGIESKSVTVKATSHAVNAGQRGYARAKGFGSHAIALGAAGEAVATGEEGCAFAVSDRTRASSMGDATVAVAAGSHSLVAVGRQSIGAAFGSGGEGMAGDDGVLILGYFDGFRRRLRVGYVGEDIEANVLYRLSEAAEFEKVINS
jgi:hypothetical protein